LLIKFPLENLLTNDLFSSIKAVDLIIPRDRGYLIDALNNERLRRHGLQYSNIFFARVYINDKDAGVYFAKERYSEFWLKKNNLPPESEVFSQTRIPAENAQGLKSNIDGYHDWRRDIHDEISDFGKLDELFYLIKDSSDKEFYENIEGIIDLEKWYKAIAINILAGDSHSIRENLNLLFNNETGKFEPLLEDIAIYDRFIDNPKRIYERLDLLSKRVLANDVLKKEFMKVLLDMSSTEELARDLKFYDELYAKLKPEFYKDQTKYKNDFSVSADIAKTRELIIKKYEIAQNLISI